MEVQAAKATEEPREGRERRKASVAASQIVRTGVPVEEVWWKKEGRPRSREKPYIILEGGEV